MNVSESRVVMGLRLTPMTASGVAAYVRNCSNKVLVCNHNLHSFYHYQKSAEFRDVYNKADLVLIDGFPIWLMMVFDERRNGAGNLSGTRCGSTDWILSQDFLSFDGSVALIGGEQRSSRLAANVLSKRGNFKALKSWNGYDDLERLKQTQFAELKEFGPDVVLFGLGMPLQEILLGHYWDQLPVAVYATVGGALDQIAGVQKLAPRWMGKVGIEWAYRLASDPRRLWRRYLVEPFVLIGILLRERCLRKTIDSEASHGERS